MYLILNDNLLYIDIILPFIIPYPLAEVSVGVFR